jgi:non-ribosomal peptide synthetase component E (peptide arylation enzyme)
LHSDGYIEIRGRLKEIVISDGETVATIEVGQVLVRHFHGIGRSPNHLKSREYTVG